MAKKKKENSKRNCFSWLLRRKSQLCIEMDLDIKIKNPTAAFLRTAGTRVLPPKKSVLKNKMNFIWKYNLGQKAENLSVGRIQPTNRFCL